MIRVLQKSFADGSMASATPLRINPVAPPVESATHEVVRRTANDILRQVDHLIKGGNIDQAMKEIIRAKEIDPANGYVYAYEERLAHLKKEHEKNIEQETTKRLAEEAARKRDAELRRQREVESQTLNEERARQEQEQKKREQTALAQHPETAVAQVPTEATTLGRVGMTGGNVLSNPERVGPDAETMGLALHATVPGSGETSGKCAKPYTANAAPELRDESNESIFVIDDDEDMLQLLAAMLTQNGYRVSLFQTSDKAFDALRTCRPRLILSDVDLVNSTMGGFTLFEKTLTFKHLADVPFVFITGLADDVIIQKGKELGVDDYLLKPISEAELLATVKGKLKRYAQVHGS
jgi:CheY-like chemotaxis protein